MAEENTLSRQWYVIHTYSGFERKVKLNIEEQFGRSSLGEKFGEVIIPTEEVVEVRKSKKKVSSRKLQRFLTNTLIPFLLIYKRF